MAKRPVPQYDFKAFGAAIKARVQNVLGISIDYLLIGEINACDHSALIFKISNLSPIHYQHLEDITNSFIAALEYQDSPFYYYWL